MKKKITKTEFLKQINENKPMPENNFGYDLNKNGGFRILTKKEIKSNRCKAYKYIF